MGRLGLQRRKKLLIERVPSGTAMGANINAPSQRGSGGAWEIGLGNGRVLPAVVSSIAADL
jgi:hypothetical protein